MPTYCYRRIDNDRIVELTMTIQELLERQDGKGTITLSDGTLGVRDFAAEHGGIKDTPGNWPMVSESAGVAPHQAREAYEHSVKIGVPTEFDRNGNAIFRDAKHRKRYCEHPEIRLYDRNGGYSDPQRR